MKKPIVSQKRKGLSYPYNLYWLQSFAVFSAIQDWLLYLESNIAAYNEPALRMELVSLAFDFYRQDLGQAPRIVRVVDTEYGTTSQVILSRSEASPLGRLLFCMGDVEAAEHQS